MKHTFTKPQIVAAYILGYIFTFFFMKLDPDYKENTWRNVWARARRSIVWVLPLVCVLVCNYISPWIVLVIINITEAVNKKFSNTKPPRWL